jgi:hypothetical protein
MGMKPPEDSGALALVHKAIVLDLAGCFEWDEDVARRVLVQKDLGGLTLAGVCGEVRNKLRSGCECEQNLETRTGYNYRYFYDIVIDCPEYPKGLYVEMRLVIDDEDYPEVRIVNAHKGT